MSDKNRLEEWRIGGDKGEHFIMIKCSLQHEDMTILNSLITHLQNI